MTPFKQYEFMKFRFPCGHSVVLPARGKSNPFVYWCANRTYKHGGTWRCGICIRQHMQTRRAGSGPDGLTGWAIILLRSLKYHSQMGGYAAPKISIAGLVRLRKYSRRCALTGRPLDWSQSPLPHLHHDHKTGEVIGFVCRLANVIDGMLAKLTPQERKTFLEHSLLDFGKESE